MSHVRALGFDALEARKLLTAAHIAALHTTPMIVAAPVVFDGTLTVDNNQRTRPRTPTAAQPHRPPSPALGALGKVRGVWNKNLDQFGDPTGLDVLRLHAPKGSLIIMFNTPNTVKPHAAAHGTVYYPRLRSSTAAPVPILGRPKAE